MNTDRKIGTLMLVEVNKQQIAVNNIARTVESKLYLVGNPLEHIYHDASHIYLHNKANIVAASLTHITKVYQPIIICDDKIKVDDTISDGRSITIAENDFWIKNGMSILYKKILVLPNQFSQEFLQAIVDQRVKDGDKVEVGMNCNDDNNDGNCPLCFYGTKKCTKHELKLRKDQTVVIHPYNETVKEAAYKYHGKNNHDNYIEAAFIAGANWNENKKK